MQKLVLENKKEKEQKEDVIFLKEDIIESARIDTNLIESSTFILTLLEKNRSLLVEINKDYKDMRYIELEINLNYGLGTIFSGSQLLEIFKNLTLLDGSEKFLSFGAIQSE